MQGFTRSHAVYTAWITAKTYAAVECVYNGMLRNGFETFHVVGVNHILNLVGKNVLPLIINIICLAAWSIAVTT